jgi:hypothetical protein
MELKSRMSAELLEALTPKPGDKIIDTPYTDVEIKVAQALAKEGN